MRRILPLLVGVLFVVGCVEGIVDHYVEKYRDDIEQEIDDIEESIERQLPECTEPMPRGRHPNYLTLSEYGGIPEGYSWDCGYSPNENQWYGTVLLFYPDGHMVTLAADGSNLSVFWPSALLPRVASTCPSPDWQAYDSLWTGKWIVTEDNRFCMRPNHNPGVVLCSPDPVYIPAEERLIWDARFDGISEGVVIGGIDFERVTCSLRRGVPGSLGDGITYLYP